MLRIANTINSNFLDAVLGSYIATTAAVVYVRVGFRRRGTASAVSNRRISRTVHAVCLRVISGESKKTTLRERARERPTHIRGCPFRSFFAENPPSDNRIRCHR